MSAPKLDDDAFTFYAMLGPERSLEAVAKHYHVNKRTVSRTSTRERWAERLEEIEKKAREKNDAKLADTMHERAMRHRKMILAMASRAAKAIQEHQLDSCMDGIKAAEIAIKLERLIAGEPSENTTVSIEQATRDEMAKLLTTEETDDWGDEPESDESNDGEASAATG